MKERSITIEFHIHKTYLNVTYPIRYDQGIARIFLVDYIAARIDKLEQERRYCNRFVWDFVAYDRCRLCLKIFEQDEEVRSLGIELADVGYPTLSMPVKKREPKFDGVFLRDEFFGSMVE